VIRRFFMAAAGGVFACGEAVQAAPAMRFRRRPRSDFTSIALRRRVTRWGILAAAQVGGPALDHTFFTAGFGCSS
jgi:hypothetical protein